MKNLAIILLFTIVAISSCKKEKPKVEEPVVVTPPAPTPPCTIKGTYFYSLIVSKWPKTKTIKVHINYDYRDCTQYQYDTTYTLDGSPNHGVNQVARKIKTNFLGIQCTTDTLDVSIMAYDAGSSIPPIITKIYPGEYRKFELK